MSVVTTDADKSNLLVYPVTTMAWNVSLLKGQDSPYVQGWFSDIYNTRVPAYCAEFSATQSKNTETFAWVMFPSANTNLPVITSRVLNSSGEIYHFEIKIAGEAPTEIAVNFGSPNEITLLNKNKFIGRCINTEKGKTPIIVKGILRHKKGKVLGENNK